MTIALFTTVWSAKAEPAKLRSDFLDQPLTFLQSVPEVDSIDLYVPETGEVPHFDEPPPPVLIVQINVNKAEQANALAQAPHFRRLLLAESAYAGPAEKVTLDVLEIVHFPIPGHASPPPRNAPLSFVVRYYGPVEDQAAFVRFYTENHPLLLATFPGIRNVLCYLPLAWQSTGKVEDGRVILGNEVVFDDLEALNSALASDVLPRLKEEGRQFAKFGYSTHHAMRRERIYSRGEV